MEESLPYAVVESMMMGAPCLYRLHPAKLYRFSLMATGLIPIATGMTSSKGIVKELSPNLIVSGNVDAIAGKHVGILSMDYNECTIFRFYLVIR